MTSIDKFKFFKYTLIFASIVGLLKIIPRTNLDTKDVLVSSIVLFAFYILIDNVFINPSCKIENLVSVGNSDKNKIKKHKKDDTDDIFYKHDEDEYDNYKDKRKYPKDDKDDKDDEYDNDGYESNKPIKYKPGPCKDCVERDYDSDNFEKYKYKIHRKYEANGSREKDGVMTTEVEYSDYNILPVHKEDRNDYEWGYTILPPEKWYPIPPHPPICVTDKPSEIYPVTTTGGGVLLKEWDSCRRITPGDVVNIDYAKDKLNSGR
jgi:hypothetical protein